MERRLTAAPPLSGDDDFGPVQTVSYPPGVRDLWWDWQNRTRLTDTGREYISVLAKAMHRAGIRHHGEWDVHCRLFTHRMRHKRTGMTVLFPILQDAAYRADVALVEVTLEPMGKKWWGGAMELTFMKRGDE